MHPNSPGPVALLRMHDVRMGNHIKNPKRFIAMFLPSLTTDAAPMKNGSFFCYLHNAILPDRLKV
jgi:hypothetical protein